MARIVKLLPFAEKNTHKYGNQFTQARVDLVRYKVPMAAVVPSFLNFIVSALVGFITSPQYGIAGRPVYHSVAGTWGRFDWYPRFVYVIRDVFQKSGVCGEGQNSATPLRTVILFSCKIALETLASASMSWAELKATSKSTNIAYSVSRGIASILLTPSGHYTLFLWSVLCWTHVTLLGWCIRFLSRPSVFQKARRWYYITWREHFRNVIYECWEAKLL